ncbi:MAG: RNA-binding protein [Nocardioides sp.]|nr:RNA-binding protein [Nocardioides sp.]
MIFAHDTQVALQAAVQLANSAGDPDGLASADDLGEFFADLGYSGRLDGDRAELEAVRALRPRLRELLVADRDTAVSLVNTMLTETDALPQLVRHDGYDWHLHCVEPDKPLAVRILAETAMAMVDVVRAQELSRLGVCADEGCDGVVLDLSRNRSRRFCSTACGNRNAVAAYRARQSDDED